MQRIAAALRAECSLAALCADCFEAQAESFEQHHGMSEQDHGVPPMPFEEAQWQVWLEREGFWQTLCPACAEQSNQQPLSTLEGATPPRRQAVENLSTTAAQQESGSQQEEALAPLASRLADAAQLSSRSMGSSSGGSPSESGPFAHLRDMELSPASREMILYWAMHARRRVRAQKGPPPL